MPTHYAPVLEAVISRQKHEVAPLGNKNLAAGARNIAPHSRPPADRRPPRSGGIGSRPDNAGREFPVESTAFFAHGSTRSSFTKAFETQSMLHSSQVFFPRAASGWSASRLAG